MESPQPVDEIMQTLQPRMAAAKRRYTRRWFSALMVLPLLIGIGVASANLNDEPVSSLAQVADGGNAVDGSVDVDPAGQDEGPKDQPAETEEEVEETEVEPEDAETETETAEYEWMSVDLGLAGTAEVRQDGDLLVLGKVELRDGWTASPFVDEGNELVLVLNNGNVHLVASLWVFDDVVKVDLDDHSEPTAEEKAAAEKAAAEKAEAEKAEKAEAEKAAAEKAAAEKAAAEKAEAEKKAAAEKAEKEKAEKELAEKEKAEKEKPEPTPAPTPKPDPEPTPTPEPESTLRSEIALYDYATVVVEADGASLELAVTWLKDGWETHIVQGTGELVHVYVTDGQYNKHLKAWVADGKIKHELWWEEIEQPQTGGIIEVDVYGKGAVKVALDGDKLYLDVQWAKEGWTAVIVHDADNEVHMYFTDGSVEKHMAAWIDGDSIAHELWVDEAATE